MEGLTGLNEAMVRGRWRHLSYWIDSYWLAVRSDTTLIERNRYGWPSFFGSGYGLLANLADIAAASPHDLGTVPAHLELMLTTCGYPSVMTEDVPPIPPHPLSLQGVRGCGRFSRGVAATNEDAASRKAVFSTAPHRTPLDLDIPQYAMHEKTLYVVTQAEEVQGLHHRGTSVSDASVLVGFENEFEFLGADLP